jgi:hypothetical protein
MKDTYRAIISSRKLLLVTLLQSNKSLLLRDYGNSLVPEISPITEMMGFSVAMPIFIITPNTSPRYQCNVTSG